MRRLLIGLTLIALLAVSIGVGVLVAEWPKLRHRKPVGLTDVATAAGQAAKVASFAAGDGVDVRKIVSTIFPMDEFGDASLQAERTALLERDRTQQTLRE